jgi:hypothetical protein
MDGRPWIANGTKPTAILSDELARDVSDSRT